MGAAKEIIDLEREGGAHRCYLRYLGRAKPTFRSRFVPACWISKLANTLMVARKSLAPM